jgi:hypothetical protein
MAVEPVENHSEETGLYRLVKRVSIRLGWNRSSLFWLSLFMATIFLILWVWWPLAVEYLASYDPRYPFWVQFDWLLLGIFLAMTFLIMARADIQADAWVVFVGFCGGLVIESWGTQTNLWTYYTLERPPLWILPAWPVASLSIDRLYRVMRRLSSRVPERAFIWVYWPLFGGFFGLMLFFVWHTRSLSLTILALLSSALIILAPAERRSLVLTFLAGSALGYFLELWGTTRGCWTYYTLETPPFFAILAHGFAAVAFLRANQLLRKYLAGFMHLSVSKEVR